MIVIEFPWGLPLFLVTLFGLWGWHESRGKSLLREQQRLLNRQRSRALIQARKAMDKLNNDIDLRVMKALSADVLSPSEGLRH